MSMQVMTANRLSDGLVVYLGEGGHWSTSIEDATVAAGEAEADDLMEAAERAVAEPAVVGPYLIDVAEVAGGLCPIRYREAIRAKGPSVLVHGQTAAAGGEG